MLSVSEAEQRVWKAVDELEEAINLLNKTPGKKDEARRADLASLLMSILARKFGITAPKSDMT
jgi:hypothetical protein